MLGLLILALSTIALGQFVAYYWRALVVTAATQPLSERARAAAQLATDNAGVPQFSAVMSLHKLTPGLGGQGSGLTLIRSYHSIVDAVGRMVPALSGWANGEKVVCARYATVKLDCRLARVAACVASSQSF
ncbi:MAG: hypothetical protein WA871_16015 [Candidatus Acidiferrales bacterium]